MPVPESTIVEVVRTYLDFGIAGATILVLIWLWLNERKARDKLQAEYLAYAKEVAALGVDMKNVTAANVQAIQANTAATTKLDDSIDRYGERLDRVESRLERLANA